MNIALREDMTPGDTLPDRLTYLERMGIDGTELSAGSLLLSDVEVRMAFAGSPCSASARGEFQ